MTFEEKLVHYRLTPKIVAEKVKELRKNGHKGRSYKVLKHYALAEIIKNATETTNKTPIGQSSVARETV